MSQRLFNVIELPANLSVTGRPVITYVSAIFKISKNHIVHAKGLNQREAIVLVKQLKERPVS